MNWVLLVIGMLFPGLVALSDCYQRAPDKFAGGERDRAAWLKWLVIALPLCAVGIVEEFAAGRGDDIDADAAVLRVRAFAFQEQFLEFRAVGVHFLDVHDAVVLGQLDEAAGQGIQQLREGIYWLSERLYSQECTDARRRAFFDHHRVRSATA